MSSFNMYQLSKKYYEMAYEKRQDNRWDDRFSLLQEVLLTNLIDEIRDRRVELRRAKKRVRTESETSGATEDVVKRMKTMEEELWQNVEGVSEKPEQDPELKVLMVAVHVAPMEHNRAKEVVEVPKEENPKKEGNPQETVESKEEADRQSLMERWRAIFN